MTNGEKFQEIFQKFATEVWAFPEKDFLTWLNAEYVEPTNKNDLGDEYISRSELMTILSDYYDTTVEYGSMLKEIAALPVVIQESTTKNDLGVDCIDRAELLKAMDTWDKFGYTETGCFVRAPKNDYVSYVHYDDMVNCVKGLPSVIPQEPRWIPVSERLPEENRTVIASAEYGFYPEARYTKEDGWEWAYESGAEYWVEIESDVLAWMPLPKPYKAEMEDKE